MTGPDERPAALPGRELGGFLRERRRASHLSLARLAEQAGVSQPYLSQVERGLRRPPRGVLEALARALQVPADALLVRAGLTGPPHDLRAAIERDPHLSPAQKAELVAHYERLRRAGADPGDLLAAGG